jgi:hypothetical protein
MRYLLETKHQILLSWKYTKIYRTVKFCMFVLYLVIGQKNANLYIYDLQGKQIKNEMIFERGEGELIIKGSTLIPGMYHYTLITDNKVVDTKTMILTD